MPLCVYLCHVPGCQVKVERWMPSEEEGTGARIPCPRCGNPLTCVWTGTQVRTPDLKDAPPLPVRPGR
jgi:hypothetical protein